MFLRFYLVVGASDIAIAVAMQELHAATYPSRNVTVKDNTILDTNNIAASSVILVYRTEGTTASVRNNNVTVMGNSIANDVGAYHGILINHTNDVNVLDNKINISGRNGTGKYGIFLGNQVDGAYYNGNQIWRNYAPPVAVDALATNVRAGTTILLP